MQKKIKLFDPLVERRDKLAMLKVLKSKFWASGSGIGYVAKFEENFNKYIGSKQSISLNSGTAALHLALSLFNIKNQEVILPSLSFVSTAHAVLYNGGKPIFVDVDPQTLCIDPEAIKKAISKKTRVILPVHFGGMPSDLDEILNLCKQHDIKLIEDAAHAVGSIYNNKKIGTHGNAVCFSFHPVKNLAMPSGGAITLNNENKNKLQILKAKRWCGITNRKGVKYDVKELGWNYYMNEFSAAIGIEQLKKLDKMNKKRRQIAHRYSKEIELDLKMPFNKNCCPATDRRLRRHGRTDPARRLSPGQRPAGGRSAPLLSGAGEVPGSGNHRTHGFGHLLPDALSNSRHRRSPCACGATESLGGSNA